MGLELSGQSPEIIGIYINTFLLNVLILKLVICASYRTTYWQSREAVGRCLPAAHPLLLGGHLPTLAAHTPIGGIASGQWMISTLSGFSLRCPIDDVEN